MNRKQQLITLGIVAALVIVGAFMYSKRNTEQASPSPSASSTAQAVLKKETDALSINVTYPAFDESLKGAKEANRFIKENIDLRISQFEKEANDSHALAIDLPREIKSTVTGSPSIEEENDRYVSMFFGSEWYLRGAAHPYHTINTYIFDKKLGKLVTIQDLFMPYSKYFQALSSYAYEDLKKQSEEGDLGLTHNDEMLRSGTEGTLDNFRLALPIKDGLVIYFEEYQVAPYAAGPQQVVIPYAYLREFINPESVLSMYLK